MLSSFHDNRCQKHYSSTFKNCHRDDSRSTSMLRYVMFIVCRYTEGFREPSSEDNLEYVHNTTQEQLQIDPFLMSTYVDNFPALIIVMKDQIKENHSDFQTICTATFSYQRGKRKCLPQCDVKFFQLFRFSIGRQFWQNFRCSSQYYPIVSLTEGEAILTTS